jgi:flagella basal body P-ring formation protein FlgA
MEQPVKIPTDSFGVEVVGLQATRPGHFGVDYRSVAGSDEVRFQMKALADEWRLMPVAAKPLKKGQVVSAADVQLNRIHGIAVAREMIEQLGDVVGKTLTRDVGQGEMFQAKAVTLPPVITAGSRVSMLYRHGRLEASAVGVALESGAAQQEIKVRNEDSQKTVTARVVDKGLVEVEAR